MVRLRNRWLYPTFFDIFSADQRNPISGVGNVANERNGFCRKTEYEMTTLANLILNLFHGKNKIITSKYREKKRLIYNSNT